MLLAYPPGVEMICAFFACVRLGLIPVPVYPPTSHGFQAALDKTDFIARDCQAAAVLTGRSYYWSMKLNETRNSVATLSFRRAYVSRLKWIVSTDADKGARADFSEAPLGRALSAVHLGFDQRAQGRDGDPRQHPRRTARRSSITFRSACRGCRSTTTWD